MSAPSSAPSNDLLADLKADQSSRAGCIFCAWVRTRPEGEQSQWDTACEDPATYSTASLHRQAVARGWKRGDSAIRTHRNQKHVVR